MDRSRDYLTYIVDSESMNLTRLGVAHPFLLLLLLAVHTNGLPLNSSSEDYSKTILTIREEPKSDSDLSNEAIISIAVPVGLFIVGLATRIKRKRGREEKAKSQRKVHNGWWRSR